MAYYSDSFDKGIINHDHYYDGENAIKISNPGTWVESRIITATQDTESEQIASALGKNTNCTRLQINQISKPYGVWDDGDSVSREEISMVDVNKAFYLESDDAFYIPAVVYLDEQRRRCYRTPMENETYVGSYPIAALASPGCTEEQLINTLDNISRANPNGSYYWIKLSDESGITMESVSGANMKREAQYALIITNSIELRKNDKRKTVQQLSQKLGKTKPW